MGLFLFIYEDCEEILKGEDTMKTYVISVKRTKNYIGNQLAEDMQKRLIQLRRRESGFMRKVNI